MNFKTRNNTNINRLQAAQQEMAYAKGHLHYAVRWCIILYSERNRTALMTEMEFFEETKALALGLADSAMQALGYSDTKRIAQKALMADLGN